MPFDSPTQQLAHFTEHIRTLSVQERYQALHTILQAGWKSRKKSKKSENVSTSVRMGVAWILLGDDPTQGVALHALTRRWLTEETMDIPVWLQTLKACPSSQKLMLNSMPPEDWLRLDTDTVKSMLPAQEYGRLEWIPLYSDESNAFSLRDQHRLNNDVLHRYCPHLHSHLALVLHDHEWSYERLLPLIEVHFEETHIPLELDLPASGF